MQVKQIIQTYKGLIPPFQVLSACQVADIIQSTRPQSINAILELKTSNIRVEKKGRKLRFFETIKN